MRMVCVAWLAWLTASGCGAVSWRSQDCIAYGDYEQCHWAGREFVRAGNYGKAVQMFTRACSQGYPGGCINLALLYEAGLGKKNHVPEARRLMKEACNPVASGCVAPVEPVEGVVLDWKLEPYAVQGRTMADLEASVKRANGNDGTWARLNWDMDAEVPCTASAPGESSVDQLRVRLHLTLREPQWTDRPRGETTTTRNWDDQLRRLHLHEMGHAYLAIAGANRAAHDFGGWPPEAPCAAAPTTTKSVVSQALRQINEENARYDAQTRHGVWLGDAPMALRPGSTWTEVDQAGADGNVERAVTAALPRLAGCVRQHPSAEGSPHARARLKLGPNGRALAIAIEGTGLTPALTTCLDDVLRRLTYGYFNHAPLELEQTLRLRAAPLTLDSWNIQRTIRGATPGFDRCSDMSSADFSVTTDFYIENDGAVATPKVVKSTAPAAQAASIGACFEAVLRGLRFPPPSAGRTRVTYPFRIKMSP